jgi:hypothetical protein
MEKTLDDLHDFLYNELKVSNFNYAEEFSVTKFEVSKQSVHLDFEIITKKGEFYDMRKALATLRLLERKFRRAGFRSFIDDMALEIKQHEVLDNTFPHSYFEIKLKMLIFLD